VWAVVRLVVDGGRGGRVFFARVGGGARLELPVCGGGGFLRALGSCPVHYWMLGVSTMNIVGFLSGVSTLSSQLQCMPVLDDKAF